MSVAQASSRPVFGPPSKNDSRPIAESLEDVRHAVSLVRVNYTSAEPVLRMDSAAAQKTATLPEKWVGQGELQVARGDASKVLAAAPNEQKIEVTYPTPIENHHNPIATSAEWTEPNELLLHESTRGLKQLQQIAAPAFALTPEKVTIVCTFPRGESRFVRPDARHAQPGSAWATFPSFRIN